MTRQPSATPLWVAILSGKGGSGKTTLAVNLALSSDEPVGLLDCDVEEPNSHFYIKPKWRPRKPVLRLLPQVVAEKCNSCGRCAAVCRFNSLVMTPDGPLFVPELCESCGVCVRACPNNAIREIPQEVGWIEPGVRKGIFFSRGVLRLGCTQGPLIIRALKKTAPAGRLTFLDGPPGSACPAVETLRGCVFAVLVVEPTRFGLHDLGVISRAAKIMSVPAGVVVNHSEGLDKAIRSFADSENLSWLGVLPDDRRFSEAGLKGLPLVEALPETKPLFANLLKNIRAAIGIHHGHSTKRAVPLP